MSKPKPSAIIQDAAERYGIDRWGAGYFSISELGEVVVSAKGEPGRSVSLMQIVEGLKERGLQMPILLRLCDVLDAQIQQLHESFSAAIAECGYQGTYRGVYPIKVNQQQQVVKEVAEFGARFHHGLETGTKAELIAALSFLQDKQAYLICNGYKDEEYIDLGLYALKMGFSCIFVVETPSEAPLILKRAERLGVQPKLGVRVKLASQAKSHWGDSGGDRSVFGLTVTQLVELVDFLREQGQLDALVMLHYHLGSQLFLDRLRKSIAV